MNAPEQPNPEEFVSTFLAIKWPLTIPRSDYPLAVEEIITLMRMVRRTPATTEKAPRLLASGATAPAAPLKKATRKLSREETRRELKALLENGAWTMRELSVEFGAVASTIYYRLMQLHPRPRKAMDPVTGAARWTLQKTAGAPRKEKRVRRVIDATTVQSGILARVQMAPTTLRALAQALGYQPSVIARHAKALGLVRSAPDELHPRGLLTLPPQPEEVADVSPAAQ